MAFRRKPKPHKYYRQQLEGQRAKPWHVCPYGVEEIGKRCAWLAGMCDANKSVTLTQAPRLV